MKKKRNIFTDAFKAKVALEACKGVKTANELAMQYKVHPSQIAQWKKQLVSGAPELFARGKNGQSATEEELTAPLYEEIGRLKMDIKWLEKSYEPASADPSKLDIGRPRIFDSAAMSLGRLIAQQCLLRTGRRVGGEP